MIYLIEQYRVITLLIEQYLDTNTPERIEQDWNSLMHAIVSHMHANNMRVI